MEWGSPTCSRLGQDWLWMGKVILGCLTRGIFVDLTSYTLIKVEGHF